MSGERAITETGDEADPGGLGMCAQSCGQTQDGQQR